MKLYKYNQDETVKYWDTQEEIDIPEYKFNEKMLEGFGYLMLQILIHHLT